jgi:hypothetical protein
MKKLTLALDALEVEAFETLPTGGRGTVAGQNAVAANCTAVEDYSCYEDCTTRGEDLSCQATCASLTYYAPGCGTGTAAAY